MLKFGIDQDEAAWAKQGLHSPIIQANIPIQVTRRLIEQGAFQIAPPLYHTRQEFGPAWVKGRIKANRQAQTCRPGRKMGVWRT